jgi:hypothetical protein
MILFYRIGVYSPDLANPNNPDLDFITMKQFLVKTTKLANPKLGAEAYVLIQVLNSNTRDHVEGS